MKINIEEIIEDLNRVETLAETACREARMLKLKLINTFKDQQKDDNLIEEENETQV